MDLRTVLLIVLSAVAAIIIVFYQYFYKNQRPGSLRFILAALRFVAIFCGLLLLVNPKFIANDYFIEKSNLIVLADDSQSIRETNSDAVVSSVVDQIVGNPDLNKRFSLHRYGFGKSLDLKDTLGFDKKNTDIAKALTTADQIFVNSSSAVILITDGNQTLGKDYQYFTASDGFSVYPVVVGDTTAYEDVSIGFLNTNKYAFLKNKFPVETNIIYNGANPIVRNVTISVNGIPVYRRQVNLSNVNKSYDLKALIDAESVGIKTIKVEIEPLENEKNPFNNVKQTAVEVIDEKTDVLLISDMLHPDIGALKKAIESNEQRSVTIEKPSVSQDRLEQADILILYQPNGSYRRVYEHISKSRISYFTIVGTHTDWNFLNSAQQEYTFQNTKQTEDIVPVQNKTFSLFSFGDFSMDGFPPLRANLGDLVFSGNVRPILFQKIKGVDLNTPLFAILDKGQQKEALLFGENLWKWRVQTFRNDQSFQNFDDFFGKLLRYLSRNNQKNRLDLDYNSVFESPQNARIQAYYFDKSYEFDPNAILTISVSNEQGTFQRESPMVLRGGFYETDLSDLESGNYSFSIKVAGENLNKGGKFKILDFNPEKQLLSANFRKLEQLAQKTKGSITMADEIQSLITDLLNSERYRPVQKSRQNIVSLIDFRILLGLMVLALGSEWFLRKYNGLI